MQIYVLLQMIFTIAADEKTQGRQHKYRSIRLKCLLGRSTGKKKKRKREINHLYGVTALDKHLFLGII